MQKAEIQFGAHLFKMKNVFQSKIADYVGLIFSKLICF